jgi:ABC-type polysaccharide/polyol phosphate transport system ATPase subunit
MGFKYKKGDLKALEKINFKINAGDKICIIGPNGSGKTTLGKILTS